MFRFLKRAENTPSQPSQATSSTPNNESDGSSVTELDFGERHRVKTRYKEAATLLQKSITSRQGLWGSFDFPQLSGEPEDFNDAQFRENINKVLVSHESSIKDRTTFSKCKYTVECIFTALSPFAKNFLTIAKEAQSALPFNILFTAISNISYKYQC